MEKVILVDKKDKAIGVEEKIKAHQERKLHRAFSVFLFNKKGETLIQKRAKSKYHLGGLWANTCCSHPRPKENPKQAAKRKLKEEMGIECNLREAFSFVYKTKLTNLGKEGKLSSSSLAAVRVGEHEFDHVFFGRFNGKPKPNKKEVADWQWVKLADLETDIKKTPQKYTPWLKIIFKKIKKEISKKK